MKAKELVVSIVAALLIVYFVFYATIEFGVLAGNLFLADVLIFSLIMLELNSRRENDKRNNSKD